MATKTPRTRKPRRDKDPAGGSGGVVVAPMNLKPSNDAPKPGGPPAGNTRGIYLDDESRAKLLELESQTGKSASRIIRELIKNADGQKMARLAALTDEMKSLLK